MHCVNHVSIGAPRNVWRLGSAWTRLGSLQFSQTRAGFRGGPRERRELGVRKGGEGEEKKREGKRERMEKGGKEKEKREKERRGGEEKGLRASPAAYKFVSTVGHDRSAIYR